MSPLRAAILALCLLQPATSSARSAREHGTPAVASWYGARHEGRPMTNGHRFRRQAATAAHRTLPLGRRVRVTNPGNGRSEVVTITDRGPSNRRRDIDLSEGTATRLGLRQRGVARVLLQPLP